MLHDDLSLLLRGFRFRGTESKVATDGLCQQVRNLFLKTRGPFQSLDEGAILKVSHQLFKGLFGFSKLFD